MPLLFLRHAKAGKRTEWDPPDHLRPLSDKGRVQADALVEALARYPVTRILSSPYVRCVQSVEPLAHARGLPVEVAAELAEGTGSKPTLELMRRLAATTAVLCTHGDVMVDVLEALEDDTGLVLPDEYPCGKGGTWVFEGDGFPFRSAHYLPPPA